MSKNTLMIETDEMVMKKRQRWANINIRKFKKRFGVVKSERYSSILKYLTAVSPVPEELTSICPTPTPTNGHPFRFRLGKKVACHVDNSYDVDENIIRSVDCFCHYFGLVAIIHNKEDSMWNPKTTMVSYWNKDVLFQLNEQLGLNIENDVYNVGYGVYLDAGDKIIKLKYSTDSDKMILFCKKHGVCF